MTRMASKMRPVTAPQPRPMSGGGGVPEPEVQAGGNTNAVDAGKPNGKAPQEMERVIKLDFPVTFASITYNELTVRRLKARDLRAMDITSASQGQVGAGITITALICGVDEAVIDELDISDYMKIQAVVSDFFPTELAANLQDRLSR